VYTLCIDGHWFSGVRCPNDGSESEWSREVSEAVHRAGTNRISLDLLIASGLSVEASRQVLVIEQDLASWPTASPIEIIELRGDTH
jgi:hypothetical protein